MPVTCMTTTTNRNFVAVTHANKMALQSIAFFGLVADFRCILRMQRQVSEFSLTARSSQEKRTSQSGKTSLKKSLPS